MTVAKRLHIIKTLNRAKTLHNTNGGGRMRSYLTVNDVIEILGVSRSQAYKVIRNMNNDLAAKGYLTVQGKVPKKYFEEQWYGFDEGRSS